MIKSAFKKLLKRHHAWRAVGFDELTELYVSSMLRTFAVSSLMVFVPFYLYQQGNSVAAIMVFYGMYFAAKALADVIASYFVARFGPKHAMIISCCLQIISSAMFVSLPHFDWPLWLLALVAGSAASFFFIAYHVEFSKIKHTLHAGKEIGTMQMFERVAAVLGPLFGGLAGSYLGEQYIFLVATVILIFSLWPLFRSAEQVRTRQQLRIKEFPLRGHVRDYIAYNMLGIETTLCVNVWPLYVSLFALSGAIYAQLGALSSFSMLVSVAAAYFVGRLIDTKNARRVLRFSVVVNSSLYAARPFVTSLLPAFAVNLSNEIVTTGYRTPFLKGVYAAADDLPGQRIVYIGSLECTASITKSAVWFALALTTSLVGGRYGLFVGFAVAGLASLGILTERFKALRSNA